ncbi:polymorphic toxin-type HINT domain-containing protein [Catenulispora pinisilvae]|uniref:polymorphic toxin-type HINT domain-containing protein n=1 Tax=Catenulispora pinisilvae TaxID=2705253 RepID=UPI001890D2EE|nr:polymorphic toxin-type HINT domain-containing protein [Catenulispora pinisilvae]
MAGQSQSQSPSPRRGRGSRRLVAVLAAAGLMTGVTVVSGPAALAAAVPHTSAAPTSTAFTWRLSQDADPSAPPDVPDSIGGGSAQIQSEITDYDTKAQALQSQSATVSAETDSLKQRESDLENQANQITSKQSGLESQASSVESQITELNNEIAAHNAEPHVFELPDQQAAYDAYNEEKASLDGRKAALQNQANSLQSSQTSLQNAESSIESQQNQLQSDIQKHNDEVTSMQSEASDLDAQRQKILSDVAEYEQQLASEPDAAPYEDAPGGDASDPAGDPSDPAVDQAAPDANQSQPAISGGDSAEPDAPYEAAPDDSGASEPQADGPVTQAPVRVTLSPDAVRALPPDETAHLDPTTTYDGLIPEADGDYAVTEPEPPAGEEPPPGQKAFDDAIDKGGKATAEVGGEKLTVDHVDPVTEAPPQDVGGDTPRPAPQSGTPNAVAEGPAVSLSQLQSNLDDQGLSDEASQFDLEYSPKITDANGNPTYGDVPMDAAGNPELGADGKPILRFSDLGLQNPEQATETFAKDEVEYFDSQLDNPCHSFVGGTRVLMANGTTEPIAEVRAGDSIENARPGGGNEVHTVDKVHVTTTDADFVDVVMATPGGVETITSTRNHPFYDVTTAGFVNAGSLAPGDRLQSGSGQVVVVRGLRPHIGPMVTYDLTIDGVHTYYVVAGHTPVLVHNCGGWIDGHEPNCICDGMDGDPVYPEAPDLDQQWEEATGGTATRDIHGMLREAERAAGDEIWNDPNSELLVQKGGLIVKVLDVGNGNYSVAVRDMSNPSGSYLTVMTNFTQQELDGRLTSGIWGAPNG